MRERIRNYFAEHNNVIAQVTTDLLPALEEVSVRITECLASGHKLLVMGNGGSAADAQHLAAELVGRFVTERQALPAIALTTDSSILTAVGNDYGFNEIFQRQVRALARSGDVVLGISTSGNSSNVLKGIVAAKESGCVSVGLLGCDGGKIAPAVDLALTVPSKITSHVQEAHIVMIHMLCLLIDEAFAPDTLAEEKNRKKNTHEQS